MIRLIAVVVALALASDVAAQGGGAPAAPGQPRQPASNPWPQELTSNGKAYRVYQPAVTGLDGARAYLVTQVGMSSGGGGADANVTGEAKLEAEVMAADVPGEVELNRFRVREFTVDGSPVAPEDAQALSDMLHAVALTTTRTNLLQGMQLVNARGSSTPGLSEGMPDIRVVHAPSLLVPVDGAPALAPLGSTGWMRVSNTPFVLLKDPAGACWASVGGKWQKAPSMDGPFAAAAAPPGEVTAAMGAAPAAPKAVQSATPATKAPPMRPAAVTVAPAGTVLVSMDGAPRLEDACAGLQRVANTNSPLFFDGSSYYLLASGRWFRSADLDAGPWSRVAPGELPAAFAGLPRTQRFDAVRAAVPGTVEANEATLAAREIRTVTLNRAGAQPKVSLGAAPGTWTDTGAPGVRWIPSASQPVVETGGSVFCCDSGAWFTAPAASGPWSLCDRVPDAVYAIPPSCPVYPCTYVWVFGSTPDSVSFGFSAGYLGTFLADGTPVYGTGFRYAPSVDANAGAAASMPVYPQTYGYDPAYDSQTGTFTPPSDPNAGYAYYGAPDMYPDYLGGVPWTGWGWCPGWCSAWGYGWNQWWGWNHWGWWSNHWDPYYDRWAGDHHDWQRQNLNDARQRTAQRNQPLQNRTWANGRGDMAQSARPRVSSVGGAPRAQAPAMDAQARQDRLQSQFRGAPGDAPAAFRGPGNEYGGYAPDAYRPWSGMGSEYGGNWGYRPLAGPDGFHPPQQFIAPGAYWGDGARPGGGLGPNAGPYQSPQGHGGWGNYDRWAGEGVRGTEYGRYSGGARRGGGRR
jgi:hypothetical protein